MGHPTYQSVSQTGLYQKIELRGRSVSEIDLCRALLERIDFLDKLFDKAF
jgi:hypothetical protein